MQKTFGFNQMGQFATQHGKQLIYSKHASKSADLDAWLWSSQVVAQVLLSSFSQFFPLWLWER